MKNTNILISGAGIAGPALAYWLKRYGFSPTVVEQAPEPRTGGYLIDFRGTGMEVAERMEVMPRVRAEQWVPREMVFVTAADDVIGKVDLGRLFKETFDDPRRAQTQLMRSKLARILYDTHKEDVEYVFADSVREIREDAQGVDVAFEKGRARRFDLVVGADGIHSVVRALTFRGRVSAVAVPRVSPGGIPDDVSGNRRHGSNLHRAWTVCRGVVLSREHGAGVLHLQAP